MKDQGSFLSLLPWLFLALLVVVAVAPYLGSRPGPQATPPEGSLIPQTEVTAQTPGGLSDLDELVGK